MTPGGRAALRACLVAAAAAAAGAGLLLPGCEHAPYYATRVAVAALAADLAAAPRSAWDAPGRIGASMAGHAAAMAASGWAYWAAEAASPADSVWWHNAAGLLAAMTVYSACGAAAVAVAPMLARRAGASAARGEG